VPPPELPHPLTGRRFPSPVAPGTGWPGDPADAATPVARSASDAASLAAASQALADVDACSSVCRACPRLVAWREDVAVTRRRAYAGEPYWGRPITGWGDERAHLLIVGLAPAAHGGNRTGRIFTGDRSGDWLFAALHRAGLADLPTSTAAGDGQRLRGVRITAAVRCAPPGNRPEPGERDACASWLDREVTLLEPGLRAVLALGGFAWEATLGCIRRLGWTADPPRPRFAHGGTAQLVTGAGRQLALVGSYHVSQQNTFTGRLTESMLDAALAEAAGLPPNAP